MVRNCVVVCEVYWSVVLSLIVCVLDVIVCYVVDEYCCCIVLVFFGVVVELVDYNRVLYVDDCYCVECYVLDYV